jgi:hypothetical protein
MNCRDYESRRTQPMPQSCQGSQLELATLNSENSEEMSEVIDLAQALAVLLFNALRFCFRQATAVLESQISTTADVDEERQEVQNLLTLVDQAGNLRPEAWSERQQQRRFKSSAAGVLRLKV